MTNKNPYENLGEIARRITAGNGQMIETNLMIQEAINKNVKFVESQQNILRIFDAYKVPQSQIERTIELLAKTTDIPSLKTQIESIAQVTHRMGITLSSSLASTAKMYADTLATINMLIGIRVPLPKVDVLLSDIEERPQAYDATPEQEAAVDAVLEARAPGLTRAIDKLGDLLHLSDPAVRRRYIWGIKSSIFSLFVMIYIAFGGKDFETFAAFGKDMGVNPLQVALETGDRVGLLLDEKYSDSGDEDGS
ncbi:hypothetical protein B5P43_18365 [Bacillus sp. SRB_336]|nr:hypothetical protein B5P43_18365 [Bacillus sp. SRB_336]